MTQKEFNELSKRYLDGRTTAEEDRKIQAWYDTQLEFHQHNAPDEASQTIGKRIWSNIRQEMYDSTTGRITRMAWIVGIAASMLLAFVWLSHFDLPPPATKTADQTPPAVAQRGIELKNTTFSDQKITLADGSLVVLKPGSSLIYNKNFNKTKRELHLHGEAFFDVTKNPQKPFIVHAGKLTAEVLGTSFSIKNAEDSKNVLVDVLSGKVSVYAEKKAPIASNSTLDRPSVILTPNQRVKYLSAENRLVKSIVEAPKFVISKAEVQKLSFVDAPISQVFDAIEKAYGLEIIYDEVVMRDCTMTTSFDEENLHDKLSIICKLLSSSFKMVDAQIVISSNGCQ
ncbi:FecR family protein [Haliscomenobacter sp.]|uniref:FecR family protein n=1 Tax=Haliscomenobacter sp. TaxID=2717303 RepID=UPI003594508C